MTHHPRMSVLFDLFTVDSAARSLLRPVMAGTGMTAEQYAHYSILASFGPLSVTAFAEAGHLPLTTASDILRAMERRGHLTRVRDDSDRRAWLLELTSTGREAHEEGRAAFRVAAGEVSRRLGDAEPEVRSALQTLARVCSDVAAEHGESVEGSRQPALPEGGVTAPGSR
jgi:DNA-binding MarR family transcriptional regulator